jgi:hypothetical protein
MPGEARLTDPGPWAAGAEEAPEIAPINLVPTVFLRMTKHAASEIIDPDYWNCGCYSPSGFLVLSVVDKVARSVDGLTWTVYTSVGGDWHNGVWTAWSGTLNKFVTVDRYARKVWSSSDGIVWTETADLGVHGSTFDGFEWVDWLGLFVWTGSNLSLTSPDGINWTTTTNAATVPTLITTTATMLVGIYGVRSSLSTDGKNWTQSPVDMSAKTVAIYGIAWSPELALFVAVGFEYAGSDYVGRAWWTSTDGLNWTEYGDADQKAFADVFWSSEWRLFVGTGSDVAPDYADALWTSPDGVTWTEVPLSRPPLPPSSDSYYFMYAPDLRLAVNSYSYFYPQAPFTVITDRAVEGAMVYPYS